MLAGVLRGQDFAQYAPVAEPPRYKYAVSANQQLPPPVDPSQLPSIDNGTQVAGLSPYDQPLPQPAAAGAADAVPPSTGLGRTDLLGGWTISSGTDSCQLFMTLTTWTGGYRASTRGCNGTLLKSISAWNLQGAEVVLSGQGGAPVARLASTGAGHVLATCRTGSRKRQSSAVPNWSPRWRTVTSARAGTANI